MDILLPTNMAAFILNSHNSCIYWYIDLKLAETFQNGVYLHCVKILSKNSLIEVLMASLQTKNREEPSSHFLCVEAYCTSCK